MERQLRSVEQLGPAETATIVTLPGGGDIGFPTAADEDFAEEWGASASVLEPSGVMSPDGA
jgi:hypothetical protein